MKIFKSIANFIATIIDKIIVTPLTKLIVKITGNKNANGKLFESLLAKPTALLFISLFFEIVNMCTLKTTIPDSFEFLLNYSESISAAVLD